MIVWKKHGPTVPEPVEGTGSGFDKLSHRRTKSARNRPFLKVFLSSASDFALEGSAKRSHPEIGRFDCGVAGLQPFVQQRGPDTQPSPPWNPPGFRPPSLSDARIARVTNEAVHGLRP